MEDARDAKKAQSRDEQRQNRLGPASASYGMLGSFIWVNYSLEDAFQVRGGKRKELSGDLGRWEGAKGG